jgi:16S rRNA (cytosine967-C5)-methyltransferase
MRPLRDNLRRLSLDLPCLVADAGAAPLLDSSFDRVILDLPCTGTGTLRKHPELKWRISESEIGRLSRQAARLLQGVAPLVAPGGLLIGITCSLEAEENEAVIAEFLLRWPTFAPLELGPLLTPPVERWIFAPGAWRIFPSGEHDGFTVHVLRRHG